MGGGPALLFLLRQGHGFENIAWFLVVASCFYGLCFLGRIIPLGVLFSRLSLIYFPVDLQGGTALDESR